MMKRNEKERICIRDFTFWKREKERINELRQQKRQLLLHVLISMYSEVLYGKEERDVLVHESCSASILVTAEYRDFSTQFPTWVDSSESVWQRPWWREHVGIRTLRLRIYSNSRNHSIRSSFSCFRCAAADGRSEIIIDFFIILREREKRRNMTIAQEK